MSRPISNLIGSWKLIEHSQIDEDLKGLLQYSNDFSMSAHITGKREGRPVLISYSGTFAADRTDVVHKVEASDNPARVGIEQRRFWVLRKDTLTLTDDSDFKAVWKRES